MLLESPLCVLEKGQPSFGDGEAERERGRVSMTPSHNTAYWLIASTMAKAPSKGKWLHTAIQYPHTQKSLQLLLWTGL